MGGNERRPLVTAPSIDDAGAAVWPRSQDCTIAVTSPHNATVRSATFLPTDMLALRRERRADNAESGGDRDLFLDGIASEACGARKRPYWRLRCDGRGATVFVEELGGEVV